MPSYPIPPLGIPQGALVRAESRKSRSKFLEEVYLVYLQLQLVANLASKVGEKLVVEKANGQDVELGGTGGGGELGLDWIVQLGRLREEKLG